MEPVLVLPFAQMGLTRDGDFRAGDDALMQHCDKHGQLLAATGALRSQSYTEAQKFAVVSAALWEADAVICAGGMEAGL